MFNLGLLVLLLTCSLLRSLTSTEYALCCHVVGQLGQAGVFSVVQLPARDAQVELQPGWVCLCVAGPYVLVIAFVLTGTLPVIQKIQRTGQ